MGVGPDELARRATEYANALGTLGLLLEEPVSVVLVPLEDAVWVELALVFVTVEASAFVDRAAELAQASREQDDQMDEFLDRRQQRRRQWQLGEEDFSD